VRINTQDTTIGENDTGNIWLNTVGLHVKDTFGGFDIEGTYANQSGIFGGVMTSAYAAAFVGGYTFTNNYQPRVTLAYTFASGDKNPNDGKRGTFDGLYGSPAVYYGRMNLFYWMNIHDIQSDLSLRPLKKGLLLFSYHYFMLAESRDGWYSTGAKVWRSGASAMRQKDGSSGNELGHEIDMVATYPINKSIKFQFGYSHLFPGKFIRTMALNPSGNNWFYTQLEWNI
jgi:hypothetical protein